MTIQTLLIRYMSFAAAVAMISNLTTKRLVLLFADTGGYFTSAMVAGKTVGLVIKYALVKRWILVVSQKVMSGSAIPTLGFGHIHFYFQP